MTDTPPPDESTFEVRLDTALEGGVYANVLGMMFSAHEFTLDFLVSLPPETRATAEGGTDVVQPMRVTSRVRIAPTVIFDLMRTLEANMTMYERQFGEIRRFDVEEPLYPPDSYPEAGDPPEGGEG